MAKVFAGKPSALETQLASETAACLGRIGRDLEYALAQLRGEQATSQRSDPRTVHACAQLVWEYFVQREACGLADQTRVIELLGIPDEVLKQVGAPPQSGLDR